MIDLRQMELFITVAEELHFGRAAARSGMSQPPFSQQIRRLERELGVALLHRTSRRVSLTPAGEVMLADARELISGRDRIVERVRRTASGDAGALRIGFSASSAVGILPMLVRQVRSHLPDVTLQIDDRDGIDIAAAIRAGALDVAIVRGPFSASGVVVETLCRDGFVAVLPASHPLAGRGELAISDLSSDGFILFPRIGSPGLYDTIIGLCTDAGFSPVVVQEADGWLSVVGWWMAVWALPSRRRWPPASAAGVVAIPIAQMRHWTELVIVYRMGGLDPLVARFRDIARSLIND